MIQVMIRSRFETNVSVQEIERIARTVLRMESVSPEASLGVVIVDDDEIQSLNRRFRDIDAPTDVLAFADDAADSAFVNAPDEPPYLGDVIVSFPRARAQAKEQGHDIAQELRLLVVHGVMHLLGYDHAMPDERAEMWDRQGTILNALVDVDHG